MINATTTRKKIISKHYHRLIYALIPVQFKIYSTYELAPGYEILQKLRKNKNPIDFWLYNSYLLTFHAIQLTRRNRIQLI